MENMKVLSFVLKIVGFALSVAAVACLVIGFWTEIADVAIKLTEKLQGSKISCCDDSDFADVM